MSKISVNLIELMRYLAIMCGAWNVFVFLMYALDKMLAKKRGARRISERTLILAAFLFGALGASFGMRVFRHKTLHTKFKILVGLALLINVFLAWACYKFVLLQIK